MQKKAIVVSVVLYLVSTGISYAGFNFLAGGPERASEPVGQTAEFGLAIDPNEPRDQECSMNGDYFTKTERDAWEKRRPLIVMIENSPDARPHSGIDKADIVYEAVAEGGVTRFMPVYYCKAQADDVVIAPVRSVRTYFIDWASEYGETPLFGHVGGANCSADKLADGNFGPCKTDKRAQAIEQLASYGWRYSKGNDLDQFAAGAPKKYPDQPAYVRNESRTGKQVATEHSVVARSELLWQLGLERGWTNEDLEGVEWTENFTPWKFADQASDTGRGTTEKIAFEFWDGYGDFAVKWEYDRAANEYKRYTGGQAHTILETGGQIVTKNVVVQFTREIGPIDEPKHMLYTTSGEGKALIFQNGNVLEGTWSKAKRTDRTIFKDSKGREVTFARGPIWISVVATGTTVDY
ncbi:hypothetical protein A3A66_04180 [Microgenomates group bacterium RIFCSPLOWO2_01_FULL_46_13]|nr:MAG: hypothetical protein A2783_03650 [Microgenomates group bacterium RIFCSPHIGHO2_01_FULL_45_11]OGV94982.1 MAG: hypothetical protein A3A66_04180 [Microgenomates group bacterium RIFCSPLOWO2_01_FULL_46_13]